MCTSPLVCICSKPYGNGRRGDSGWGEVTLESGFRRVVVESDAQAIIKLWKTEEFDRTEIVGVLHEIRELSGHYESFRLIFVRGGSIM